MGDWVQETSDWLIKESLSGTRADRLMRGFCDALVRGGVPLVRGHIASGQLHPLFRAFSVTWNRDEGIIRDRFSYDGATSEAWNASPLKAVLTTERPEIRARLSEGEGVDEFPVLTDFRNRGFTDYYCTRVAFTVPEEEALKNMEGCIITFASDAPGGFSDPCIGAIKRLFPRLAAAIKMVTREATAQNLASTYLGSQAGDRVLKGQIRRGDYDRIRAAVWYCDMRGSTRTADTMQPEIFLGRLNRYFGATAGSVLDHGGEVLRFIGDAVLAIFPINGPGGAERAGRMALAAAKDAVLRLQALNADPPDEDPEPIEFGLGLHVGDILFGNIGVPERLEFSVIGAVANETARLEDLTKQLDRTILASDGFVANTSGNWEAMGSFRLRGVAEPQPVYALTF
ncbi:MAG: adenylate/guanylate cyclase domain-containing protein [Alphaproteobacteria bacterium]